MISLISSSLQLPSIASSSLVMAMCLVTLVSRDKAVCKAASIATVSAIGDVGTSFASVVTIVVAQTSDIVKG
ncbi:hypothetical protein AKJ16_DCAP18524 [Drosera capensis]